MQGSFTVRIEDDAEGIWVLREKENGDRFYHMAQSASDLHREGYIYFKQKWVKQPSRGGDINEFLREVGL